METPEKNPPFPRLPEGSFQLASAQLSIRTNAGEDLLASIEKAKHSVRVVSPFISIEQTEKLADKYREIAGNIKLITGYASDDHTTAQREALKKLILPVQGDDGTMNYTCIFNTVVCKGYFLHAKLYLVDDSIAYIGSLNFTGHGIRSNCETCLKTEDEAGVKALCKHYDKLFAEIKGKWNIAELRQELYADTKPYLEKILENDSGLHE
jgi:phosphatidylserine/phosphatidylglycerophosphate/cardiolipin synthase-like enzyme